MVWNVCRSMKLAALGLGLWAVFGCVEDNEKNFTSTPGSAPPGSPVDGEAPPRPRKTRAGQPVNE